MEALKQLNDQILGVWTIYISFYTAFLTVNLAALAIVAEKLRHEGTRRLTCAAFVVQNFLSLCTAVGMAYYTSDVAASLDKSAASILTSFRHLGVWGGIANAVSHAVFIVLWVWVGAWGYRLTRASPSTSTSSPSGASDGSRAVDHARPPQAEGS